MEFNPPFIDVTYHREDYIYKEREDGLLEKVSYRKRPGTVAICAAIMNRYKVDAVPHLICGGFTKEETENALIDLQFLGIDNVLVLRGDARKADAAFVPTPGGHAYASGLLKQVTQMNQGKYLHQEHDDTFKTDFCIGVAGYPEKHFESPNLKTDFKYLKKKVKNAIKFITDFETQLVYQAKERGCKGVIAGHIHTPADKIIKGIHYLNCGDWIENNSYIVYDDKKFELKQLD
jgi:methylenetetrahydrofolate reductase (NADPH)